MYTKFQNSSLLSDWKVKWSILDLLVHTTPELVHVIGWSAVLFGINSASNAGTEERVK